MRLTLDGGDGSDVIIGGSGDDVLRGGGEFDDVTPNKGNDFVDLGGDNDRSSWKPGDGNDHVVGRGGRDSLFFLGSADAERFELAARGGGVRLRRDVGAIEMTLEGIEEIDTLALGGPTRSASATSPARRWTSSTSASRRRSAARAATARRTACRWPAPTVRTRSRWRAASPPRASPAWRRRSTSATPRGRSTRSRSTRAAARTRSTAPAWRPAVIGLTVE